MHMFTCTMYLWRANRVLVIGSSETGVTSGCELLGECWELNSDPQQEQQVFSFTEVPLQQLY